MRQVDIVKEIGLTKQEVSSVIKRYAKPTNADRIRAMSDEELAEWIIEETEDDTPGWLEWLKQEAK
jgi:hypothetical protein